MTTTPDTPQPQREAGPVPVPRDMLADWARRIDKLSGSMLTAEGSEAARRVACELALLAVAAEPATEDSVRGIAATLFPGEQPRDDHHNNRLAAGGISAVLSTAGLDPVFETDTRGLPTNAMTIKLPFLDSRYRVTVERVPDDETAAAAEGGAGR